MVSQTRPISNNSVMTKVFTSICNEQIKKYIEANKLLTNFQSGFRNKHSCTTALMRVTEDIKINISNGRITILALLDIKSAYPSVSHKLLLHVLTNSGFSRKSIEWIKCFTESKAQYVRLENTDSREIKIDCGLIQGDNLSQTLFSLVINGIVNVVKNCKIHLYANDVALYIDAEPHEIIIAISMINRDIEAIDKWIKANGMQLNPEKTQTTIIGSKNNLNKISQNNILIPKIRVGPIEIEYSDSVKYLGVHFNSLFTASNQIAQISKNVNFTLSKIRHCRKSVGPKLKLKLVKGVICPLFDYAAIIYHGFGIHGTGEDENKLRILYNSCIRYICNLSHRDHVSESLNELEMLNAFNRRSFLITNIIYSFLNTGEPKYLANIFKTNQNQTRAGMDTITLLTRQVRNVKDEHLLEHCATKLWNSIPTNIRNLPNKKKFANEYKKYLLDKQKIN